jgi:hypothetical protein
MKVLGIILIVLGVIGLVYGGLTFTRKEKVVDLGPVEITRTENERIPLPPVAGGICLVAGLALVLAGRGRG